MAPTPVPSLCLPKEPKYPPPGEVCQGSPRDGEADLVPAGAGARGTALHPPNQPLDMSDHFRHPLFDVIEFQQALPRFHLIDHQNADSIHQRAGAILVGEKLKKPRNRLKESIDSDPVDFPRADESGSMNIHRRSQDLLKQHHAPRK